MHRKIAFGLRLLWVFLEYIKWKSKDFKFIKKERYCREMDKISKGIELSMRSIQFYQNYKMGIIFTQYRLKVCLKGNPIYVPFELKQQWEWLGFFVLLRSQWFMSPSDFFQTIMWFLRLFNGVRNMTKQQPLL